MLRMDIPPAFEWLRMANRYIESLYAYKFDKWTNSTIIDKKHDDSFEKEFDFIASTLS